MKKILLYMTDFYGYNELLINEFNKQGYEVTWFLDKVFLSPIERVYSKLFKSYKKNKYQKYFDGSIKKIRGRKFDLILIIFGGSFFLPSHIDTLRKEFSNTAILYYAWDSVKNFPAIADLIMSSDVSFTFDASDALSYNANFLPLFYVPTCSKNKKINYDVSAVMSFYIEKKNSFLSIVSKLPKEVNKSFYLKIRDKMYMKRIRHKCKEFYQDYYSFLKLDSLTHSECLNYFSNSKAVIDCPLPGQVGLTMRTFEVLSLKRKLITTNQNISQYDFYTPENIFIINEDIKEIPIEFFHTPFNEDYSLGEEYSISSFVRKIIEKGEEFIAL